MKLYRYFEDYGRMGAIEGLLILTDEEYSKLTQYGAFLCWSELLGKHSEGYYNFSKDTLTVLDIPEDVVKLLYNVVGDKAISGPFDLDDLLEEIDEYGEEEE